MYKRDPESDVDASRKGPRGKDPGPCSPIRTDLHGRPYYEGRHPDSQGQGRTGSIRDGLTR